MWNGYDALPCHALPCVIYNVDGGARLALANAAAEVEGCKSAITLWATATGVYVSRLRKNHSLCCTVLRTFSIIDWVFPIWLHNECHRSSWNCEKVYFSTSFCPPLRLLRFARLLLHPFRFSFFLFIFLFYGRDDRNQRQAWKCITILFFIFRQFRSAWK